MMGDVKAIKIDPDGKYAVLVKAENPDHLLREQLGLAEERLNNWWKSDSKFILLQLGDGIEVGFERVDRDSTEEIASE